MVELKQNFSLRSFVIAFAIFFNVANVPMHAMEEQDNFDIEAQLDSKETKVHENPSAFRSYLQRVLKFSGQAASALYNLWPSTSTPTHQEDGTAQDRIQDLTDDAEHDVPTLYDQIASENLKAVETSQEESATATLNSIINDEKEIYQLIEEALAKSLHSPEEMKRSVIFKLFAAYEKKGGVFDKSDVLDVTTWKDLEILCGPKTSTSLCLAAKLDRASTQAGRAVLYRKIIQPTADVNEILKQQHNVRMLVDPQHEAFFNDLDGKLKELTKSEDVILSFFGEDLFRSFMLQNLFRLIGQEQIPFIKKIVTNLNKNELWLELQGDLGFVLSRLGYVKFGLGGLALGLCGLAQVFGGFNPEALQNFITKLDMGPLAQFTLIGFWLYALMYVYSSPRTNGLVKLGDSFVSAQALYKDRFDLKAEIIFMNALQTKLIQVATYLNNMKHVVQIASSNSEIASLPMIKNLKETFDQFVQDPEMKHLLDLLATKTFQGQASFLSYKGRVLAAYRLMHKKRIKAKLVPLMAAVGELDAQMSIARLFKEFQHNERVTFCFPKIITGEKTPSLAAINFCNPIIDINYVVPNTIALGDRYKACRNIAVSGPNAGGKTTTSVRGITICAILAQSLGIAPAQEFEFTPFNKIITYLNITDDLALGNSKFTAGVERALAVLDVAQNTQQGFTLTAVDEALDGASYEESQAAAYTLFEALGQCSHNICITTTHLPLVRELEKTGAFANYKVSVTFDEDDKIVYPYIIAPGTTDQNIVFKVLKEKGFPAKFLERASTILEIVVAKKKLQQIP